MNKLVSHTHNCNVSKKAFKSLSFPMDSPIYVIKLQEILICFGIKIGNNLIRERENDSLKVHS